MSKVREYRTAEGGLGGGHRETRVRSLKEGERVTTEKPPEGVDAWERVPDDTPEHDWEDG
jgi:hypothetical protein